MLTTEYDKHVNATIVENPCPVFQHPFACPLVYEIILKIKDIGIIGRHADVHADHCAAVCCVFLFYCGDGSEKCFSVARLPVEIRRENSIEIEDNMWHFIIQLPSKLRFLCSYQKEIIQTAFTNININLCPYLILWQHFLTCNKQKARYLPHLCGRGR